MNRDQIAALVALVAALLAGTGLPSKLGMSAPMVTMLGGLVVGLAATGRALLGTKWSAGERPNWRDILGAMLGVMAVGLGIDGVAVDQLDPNVIASLSSLGAAAFAWQRGGGDGFPTPPAAGLLLLVLPGCAAMAAQTLLLAGVTVVFALLSRCTWRRR